LSSSPQILVVQTAFLGDVVLTTPLLRELRALRPDARLTVVTTEAGAEVLQGLRSVDRLLVFRKKRRGLGLGSFVPLVARLLREPFEIAIAAQRSARTGQLLWATRAPTRIGFEGAAGAWAYGERLPWHMKRHAVRRYLDLAIPLGCDPERADARPELVVDPTATAAVERRLSRRGLDARSPFLCVVPGAQRKPKRWTPQGYSTLIAEAELRTVLVGSVEEVELCSAIAAASGADPIVLAGLTSLPEFVAVVAAARAVIANDSGASHIASAVGTPVVSIFGPTTPELGYAPFGDRNRVAQHGSLACRPCGPCEPRGPRACPEGHHRCMTDLPATLVLERLAETLREPEL